MKINTYKLFIIIGCILFCIPVQIQLPFKVLCLLVFNILALSLKKIDIKFGIIGLILIIYIYYKIHAGTFDTSLLIVCLSIIPVYYFSETVTILTKTQIKNIIKISYIWMIFMILQMLIFRYNGRPNLSYEINQSASYIFLYYLISRIIKIKWGVIFSLIAALLLLSRLLILCIIVYEVGNLLITKYKLIRLKLNYSSIILLSLIFISIFSIWYYINMAGNIVEGSDGAGRLANINDGSNFLRFKINTNIITDLLDSQNNTQLLYEGYGDLAKNPDYRQKYFLMPHNEIIKSIAQFGFLFTLFCYCIARKSYNNLLTINTIPLFLPIVLYTLILWVRFTVVPSLEMIFILFILNLQNSCYGKK